MKKIIQIEFCKERDLGHYSFYSLLDIYIVINRKTKERFIYADKTAAQKAMQAAFFKDIDDANRRLGGLRGRWK